VYDFVRKERDNYQAILVGAKTVLIDNPKYEDELLKPLGEFKDEELVTLLTITIPSEDPSKTTANFKAPLLINPNNRKGIQIIVNNEDYPIKFSIYDSVQKMKAEQGK